MNEITAQPRYSLKAGWICIGCGSLAIVLLGPLGFIVAGPLTLVSLVLAIIGMAKNNTGGGIALFIASLVLPSLVFVLWLILVALMKSGDAVEASISDSCQSALHWI
jgi:hypothetical protein